MLDKLLLSFVLIAGALLAAGLLGSASLPEALHEKHTCNIAPATVERPEMEPPRRS